MTYQAIKDSLREASALVATGHCAQADAIIQLCLQGGMSAQDFTTNTSTTTRAKLREWSRSRR